tara:strand:- start:48298 stop:48726 length:429 start_codon:yes stop_codon:yes gene_type:complete
MFSREESRQLRELFWISFGKSYPKKWVLYNTKIKDFSFKFYFDTSVARVMLDLETLDLEKRRALWDALVSIRSILIDQYLPAAIFDDGHVLENGKQISRIYVELQGVSIHDKNTWQRTMVFLNENMLLFEAFFEDYGDMLGS